MWGCNLAFLYFFHRGIQIRSQFLKNLKILAPAVTSLLLLSPILGKWTKLGNNGTTCRTDTKIGIWSILKVGNPKMKSSFRYFQNFTTCCDVIITNFREMDQIREQRKYLPDRHQNWYLEHFEGAKSKIEITFWKCWKFYHLLWRHCLQF